MKCHGDIPNYQYNLPKVIKCVIKFIIPIYKGIGTINHSMDCYQFCDKLCLRVLYLFCPIYNIHRDCLLSDISYNNYPRNNRYTYLYQEHGINKDKLHSQSKLS